MELEQLRQTHPLVYQHFNALADGRIYLEQILEIDRYWEQINSHTYPDVIFGSEMMPKGVLISGEYDLLYAGGTLSLLHATVMAVAYQRSVLVFDRNVPGQSTRDWNISRSELNNLEERGCFSAEEIDFTIACRYKTGWAEFFVEEGKKKRLYLDNVLDCAVDADKLLRLAKEKILACPGNQVLSYLVFKRCFQFPGHIVVEVENRQHEKFYYKARLLVDAMGVSSPVAMQLNKGRPQTHVCPTVGTLASGLEGVDEKIGEILVSREAADHSTGNGRQLIWEGFPAGEKRYTTYLFFYDSLDSDNDKSLLGLFETYFGKLSSYKKPGPDFLIHRPVFGIIPAYVHHGFACTREVAEDHILMIGDSAALASPLTFCGFGSFVRNIKSLTAGLEPLLRDGRLEKESLERVSAFEPNVAVMANLMKYMCYSKATDNRNFVNEMMNEVMIVLDRLPSHYRESLFKDTMDLSGLFVVGAHVACRYPEILKATACKLGLNGSIGMVKNLIGWALSSKFLKN
jgi:lycopene cyclase CruA